MEVTNIPQKKSGLPWISPDFFEENIMNLSLITRECTATCLPSFQFAGGATQLKISCDNGDWRPDTGDQVLDCQGQFTNEKIVPGLLPIIFLS